MSDYEDTFEDPILECDPECDTRPLAPDGETYTNAEHGARILHSRPRTFETRRGQRTYLDINVIVPNSEVGTIFVRSEAFGAFNTCLQKGSESLAKQFLGNLKLSGQPASAAENLPVTVTVGVGSYVAKENELSEEERAAGKEPRLTQYNFIKNIMAE